MSEVEIVHLDSVGRSSSTRARRSPDKADTVDDETFQLFCDAVLANDFDRVKEMIESGVDIDICACDSDGSTPLLNLCSVVAEVQFEESRIEGIKFLVENGANINAKNNAGITALQQATVFDFSEVCEYLIEHDADTSVVFGEREDTLLILACQYGSVKTINCFFRCEAKCKKSMQGFNPFHLNKAGKSALSYAVESNFKDIATLLIEHESLGVGYHESSGADMRQLVEKMPDVADMAFSKCIQTNEYTKTNQRIANTSESYCVYFNYIHLDELYVQDGDLQAWKYGAFTKNEVNGPSPDPKQFSKKNHLLYLIMKQRHSNLLKHPLVTSLLDYKWNKFGRYLFLLNIIIYFVFLTFLTAFGLTALSPLENTCILVFNQTFNGSTPQDCTGLSTQKYQFLIASALLTILFALVRIAVEVIQLIKHPLEFFQDWVNWLEMPLYLCSVIFVFVFASPCLCVHDWQWQIGAVSVFQAWMVLITFLQKLPVTGVYIVMFYNIIWTFLKIVFLAVLLIIAFALAFYMLLFDPREMRTPFSHPGRAFVKVVTMTTGELDYNELYHQEEGAEELAFPPASFYLWVVFLVLMPVLLNNLLVGLAVGDVNALQKVSAEERIQLQIDLILNFEELMAFINITFHLPVYQFCKIYGIQAIHPNKPSSLFPKCCGNILKIPSQFLLWVNGHFTAFLTSRENISEAIESLQLTEGKQLKKIFEEEAEKVHQNTRCIRDQIRKTSKEQSRSMEEHCKRMEEKMEKLRKEMEEQRKEVEEQNKRMEEQTKTIAERFASEIAALREALEKNM